MLCGEGSGVNAKSTGTVVPVVASKLTPAVTLDQRYSVVKFRGPVEFEIVFARIVTGAEATAIE
ncbi:hypothetical protein D3C83_121830 [compost metagenome]